MHSVIQPRLNFNNKQLNHFSAVLVSLRDMMKPLRKMFSSKYLVNPLQSCQRCLGRRYSSLNYIRRLCLVSLILHMMLELQC
uniref:Uncharacterized protein n=1 Tax=Arundo donax TaxID=35708 RepID=A0A0A9G4M0_ARUDO